MREGRARLSRLVLQERELSIHAHGRRVAWIFLQEGDDALQGGARLDLPGGHTQLQPHELDQLGRLALTALELDAGLADAPAIDELPDTGEALGEPGRA